MKKISISLPVEEWDQLKSKYPADSKFVSVDDFTAGTKNVDTSSEGVLTKVKGSTLYGSVSSAIKDQYEAVFTDGTHHLLVVANGKISVSSGDKTFTEVGSGYSPIANFEFSPAFDRHYGSNGVSAIVYDKVGSYGGVSYDTPNIKTMGCQVPSSAPTATLATDSTANQVPSGAHTYKVTYLYYGFEESNGSAASGIVTNDGTHTSNTLSSIPTGGIGVTARKVYRDNNDGLYTLVGTISNNTTTTFTDTVASGGASIPTDHNVPPAFKSITNFLERLFLAGVPGSPYDICFTDAGMPDIVKPTNYFKCNHGDPVMGIVVYLDRIIVFNRSSMGRVEGRTSDTFRYVNIQGGVGCVDSRSIKLRTIGGIPTLIWLSDKGFYGYNGSAVTYLSDPIEDIVNQDVQQAQYTKGSITHTSQADFLAGTKSDAIDLESNPGAITTINPIKSWTGLAAWEGTGVTRTGVATKDESAGIKCPTRYAPSFSTGELVDTKIASGNLELVNASAYSGESHPRNGDWYVQATAIKWAFTTPRNGTLRAITFPGISVRDSNNSPRPYRVYIRSSSDENIAFVDVSDGGVTTPSFDLSLTSGTYFVLIVTLNSSAPNYDRINYIGKSSDGPVRLWSGNSPTYYSTVMGGNGATNTSVAATIVVDCPASASLGQWNPGDYVDTFSTSATGLTFNATGTYPEGTSATIQVHGSNDRSTWTVTDTVVNPEGDVSLTGENYRYWTVSAQLETANDGVTPSLGPVTIKFPTTVYWESAPVDCTSDIATLASLVATSTCPTGTSVTLTVATSADGETYSSYSAIGEATPAKWAKVKLALQTSDDNSATPNVTSLQLSWTVSASFISKPIDCLAAPAGWDIFQSRLTLNGGTATFYMRSSSTEVGLASATFEEVESGGYSSVAGLQFAEWKVIIVSSANHLPVVEGITVNWFITSAAQFRVASIVCDRKYYISLAEFGSTSNNLILWLDDKGKWRVRRGLNVTAFSMFFNQPYFGTADGKVGSFLQGTTDMGTAIEWDVRTKANDFQAKYYPTAGEATKILRSVYIVGRGTGGEIRPYFSVDLGSTWLSLYDVETGSTSFETVLDQPFARRFSPSSLGDVSGRTILLRLYNNDEFNVRINKVRMDVLIREGELHNG